MIDTQLTLTIETMRQRGASLRAIARQLGISRNTARRVIRNGRRQQSPRQSRFEPHLDLIRELFSHCRGNLVVVHQILRQDHGINISYSALTALTRKYRIRKPAKKQSGAYVFEPGAEMQHDTTECRVTLGHKKNKLQCAALAHTMAPRLSPMPSAMPIARLISKTCLPMCKKTFWPAATLAISTI